MPTCLTMILSQMLNGIFSGPKYCIKQSNIFFIYTLNKIHIYHYWALFLPKIKLFIFSIINIK